MCAPQVPPSVPSSMNWSRVAQRARLRAERECGTGCAESLVEVMSKSGYSASPMRCARLRKCARMCGFVHI